MSEQDEKRSKEDEFVNYLPAMPAPSGQSRVGRLIRRLTRRRGSLRADSSTERSTD